MSEYITPTQLFQILLTLKCASSYNWLGSRGGTIPSKRGKKMQTSHFHRHLLHMTNILHSFGMNIQMIFTSIGFKDYT
jgi:hypothetical protein